MTDDAEGTARKQRADVLRENAFRPGQSGNPKGRQKGSRNKLGEAFIEALHDDFMEHGVKAIETVRADKPDQYLKVIASLLPKEMTLNVNDERAELTDDELIERIRSLTAAVAPLLASGAGDAEGGIGDSAGSLAPPRVH